MISYYDNSRLKPLEDNGAIFGLERCYALLLRALVEEENTFPG
jgi:hypothetical protein